MKKFVYGIFYLALFGFVIFAIYAKNTVVVPTCTDGIMNQNETGIDCGGLCISCAVKNLKALKDGSVSVFGLENGRSVFLGTIVNPNEGYVARDVSYEFVVFDTTGYPVERILGTDTVFPLEKRYAFSASADTNAQYIGNVKIEIVSSSVRWDTFYDTLKPDVRTVSGPNFSDEERSMRISGTIKNESSFSARETKVIALLFDTYDDVLFASQWTTSDMSGFGTKDFSILVPRERNIIEHIDRGKTKILIQTQ